MNRTEPRSVAAAGRDGSGSADNPEEMDRTPGPTKLTTRTTIARRRAANGWTSCCDATQRGRVRVPAATAAFFVCCLWMLAAGPWPGPARSAGTHPSHAAHNPAAVAACPAITDIGLWTITSRRPRTPRVTIRRFRTRMAYSANTSATRQTCGAVLSPCRCAGRRHRAQSRTRLDSPGGATWNIDGVPRQYSEFEKQLGSLRACAPVFERFDIVAISETWLNATVADSELGLGVQNHTWFRRDRGLLGGGVVCAVRSSLAPLRLPDPPGAEMMLIRLQSAAVTIAVCYRPPDDDGALQEITDALAALRPQDYRTVAIDDFNLPEIAWTGSESGAIARFQRQTGRATHFLDEFDALGRSWWVSPPEATTY